MRLGRKINVKPSIDWGVLSERIRGLGPPQCLSISPEHLVAFGIEAIRVFSVFEAAMPEKQQSDC